MSLRLFKGDEKPEAPAVEPSSGSTSARGRGVTMTDEEKEQYKRQMLERYEAQRKENEQIRKKLDDEKRAAAEAERKRKEEEEKRKAAEAAKKANEEAQRAALENYKKQQEAEAKARQDERRKQQGGAPNAPLSARQGRGMPQIDPAYLEAVAADGQGGAAPTDSDFDPAIQVELDLVQALTESAVSQELLVSTSPYDPEAEARDLAEKEKRKNDAELMRRKKEDEERLQRQRDAEQMAREFNINLVGAPAAAPVQRVPVVQAAPPPADETDFDAMLANLQKATAELDF